MSITYECVLLGTFDSSLLDKVRNKLRVTCDSYADLHSHEMVFTVQGGPNTTNGRMVMRRDCIDEKAKWTAVRMFRAEPATRYNPQLLIRSTINLTLDTNDNAIPFVQALGYKPNHEFMKQGVTYTCDDVLVSVYQLHNADGERVHEQNVWMTEVRSQPVVPDQSAAVDPLNVAIHNCLKLKAILKPLVQLNRVEH